jgi:hypothetical protein
MVGDVEKTNPILFFTAEQAGCAELFKIIISSKFSAFFAISAVNEVEKTNLILGGHIWYKYLYIKVLWIFLCFMVANKQSQFVRVVFSVRSPKDCGLRIAYGI